MRVRADASSRAAEGTDVLVGVPIRPDESLRALVRAEDDVALVLTRLVRLAGAHFLDRLAVRGAELWRLYVLWL
jgi:hypothetical protein